MRLRILRFKDLNLRSMSGYRHRVRSVASAFFDIAALTIPRRTAIRFLFGVLQTKSFALSASRSATRARGCFRDPGARPPQAVAASAERIFSKTSSTLTYLQKSKQFGELLLCFAAVTSLSVSQHFDELIDHRENYRSCVVEIDPIC